MAILPGTEVGRDGRTIIPRANTPTKGHWTPADRASGREVWLCCPLCGGTGMLRDNPGDPLRSDGTHGHSIDPDGTVHPSCVCPDGCGWHVFVRLDGWPGPLNPGPA